MSSPKRKRLSPPSGGLTDLDSKHRNQIRRDQKVSLPLSLPSHFSSTVELDMHGSNIDLSLPRCRNSYSQVIANALLKSRLNVSDVRLFDFPVELQPEVIPSSTRFVFVTEVPSDLNLHGKLYIHAFESEFAFCTYFPSFLSSSSPPYRKAIVIAYDQVERLPYLERVQQCDRTHGILLLNGKTFGILGVIGSRVVHLLSLEQVAYDVLKNKWERERKKNKKSSRNGGRARKRNERTQRTQRIERAKRIKTTETTETTATETTATTQNTQASFVSRTREAGEKGKERDGVTPGKEDKEDKEGGIEGTEVSKGKCDK